MMNVDIPASQPERSGPPQSETGFDRQSRIILGAAVLILLLSLAQTLYHFSLPTDGWDLDVQLDATDYLFTINQLGEPTPLKAGDVLLGVEGQSTERMLERAIKLAPQRPVNWAHEQSVAYTILRDGRELSIDVPLKRWSGSATAQKMFSNLLQYPVALVQLLIGGFVFVRRPRSLAARLLFLHGVWFFAALGISGAGTATALVAVPDTFYRAAYWPAEFFVNVNYVVVTYPLFVHLLLVFPVVKAPMRRYPRLMPSLIYGSMSGTTLFLYWFIKDQPIQRAVTAESIILIAFSLLLLTGVGSAVHTLFTARDPVKRAQIRWVAWGAFLSVGYLLAAMVTLLFGIPTDSFIAYTPRFLFVAFPVALAVAILRFRLFDIDVIINRTLVYGLLTTLLALIYFGGVVVIQRLLETLTGAGGSDLAVVGSTLGIAALFQPLRRGIQSTIDRRFYRRKYDAARTLQRFSAASRDEVDLETLTQSLLVMVDETMQPDQISLWLKTPSTPTSRPS